MDIKNKIENVRNEEILRIGNINKLMPPQTHKNDMQNTKEWPLREFNPQRSNRREAEKKTEIILFYR